MREIVRYCGGGNNVRRQVLRVLDALQDIGTVTVNARPLNGSGAVYVWRIK